MTETITYPHIEESLLDEYQEICEKIPEGTVRAEKQTRQKIAKSKIRDRKSVV